MSTVQNTYSVIADIKKCGCNRNSFDAISIKAFKAVSASINQIKESLEKFPLLTTERINTFRKIFLMKQIHKETGIPNFCNTKEKRKERDRKWDLRIDEHYNNLLIKELAEKHEFIKNIDDKLSATSKIKRLQCRRGIRRLVNKTFKIIIIKLAAQEAYDAKKNKNGKAVTYATDKQKAFYNHSETKQAEYRKNTFIEVNGLATSLPDANYISRIQMSKIIMRSYATQIIAEQKNYICVFTTDTCPPNFHTAPKIAKGSRGDKKNTSKDAIEFLRNNDIKLKKRLEKEGIVMSNQDFLEIKCTEPHFSGTPHCHSLLFSSDDSLRIILKEKFKLFNYSNEKTEGQINEMIESLLSGEVEEITNKALTIKLIKKAEKDNKEEKIASPVSYLFKYITKNFFDSGDALEDEISESGIIEKVEVKNHIEAISAWYKVNSVRRFSFRGINGALGKWDYCRKLDADKIEDNEENKDLIKAIKIAKKEGLKDNENTSNAFVRFIAVSKNLEWVKESRVNAYGEKLKTNVAIKSNVINAAEVFKNKSVLLNKSQAELMNLKANEKNISNIMIHERQIFSEESVLDRSIKEISNLGQKVTYLVNYRSEKITILEIKEEIKSELLGTVKDSYPSQLTSSSDEDIKARLHNQIETQRSNERDEIAEIHKKYKNKSKEYIEMHMFLNDIAA
ncbi:replication endonuclease [Colwellia sp. MB3u-55]|uniref:replication endonuclease n=1 Tax=Colwellia sp. MB3u-55 TaxID=2759810 RepID=UPI0015F6FD34|nr:replication endonuclease [Colwellia sp. MB3u-55]MBA6251975.1 replication endonuclease [Colwellia sp. MB3u-55]